MTTCPPPRFWAWRAVPLVGQEVFERGQQEGAELAFAAVHARQEILGQQPQKELLGQVFGLVRLVSAAADVGIERIPIEAAEFFHRLRWRGAKRGRRRPPARASSAWRQSPRHRERPVVGFCSGMTSPPPV